MSRINGWSGRGAIDPPTLPNLVHGQGLFTHLLDIARKSLREVGEFC